jgi:Tol biopolymer transport system component
MTSRPSNRRRAARVTIVLMALAAVTFTAAPQASATFPGTNGRIAFWDFNIGQVFAVNPNGSGLVQLTHVDSAHAATHPAWSPNGRFIIFTVVIPNTPEDHARIWIMRRDGTHAHQLSHDLIGYRNYTGAFTPDGQHIVFARCKPNDGVCAIWMMRSDGTHKFPLTPFREGRNEAVDFNPTVSADGSLAFGRFLWHGITSQIYVSDHIGATPKAVTPVPLEAFAPDWAPNGDMLDFSSNSFHAGSAIYQMSETGTGLHQIISAGTYPHNNLISSFSPDGTRIAFLSDRRFADPFCCFDLWAAQANGAGQHRIPTGTLNGVVDPAWGPAPGGGAAATSTSARAAFGARRTIRLPALCHAMGGHAPYC